MLYKQISQNKRNTVIIMVLFGILMLAISALFANFLTIWAGVIFFIIAIGYVLYTYFDATEHLMKVTGGVQLDKESAPEIYEMVEELCLAAGMPMPKLYVVPDSDPNAFATGRNPEHASLALTQGLLEIMNKQEVQGVIGHELSRIRNYDTRVTVIATCLFRWFVAQLRSALFFCSFCDLWLRTATRFLPKATQSRDSYAVLCR